jgi:hypothetical protein
VLVCALFRSIFLISYLVSLIVESVSEIGLCIVCTLLFHYQAKL